MKTGIMFCTNKRVKTRIYIVMFCLFSLCATGCNKETKEAGNLPVTAKWSFYYVDNNGDLLVRNLLDKAEGMPAFNTEDGKNFIVGGNSDSRLEGVLIKNEDGTYALDLGLDFTPIAEIHRDVLTLKFKNNINFVFLGEER